MSPYASFQLSDLEDALHRTACDDTRTFIKDHRMKMDIALEHSLCHRSVASEYGSITVEESKQVR